MGCRSCPPSSVSPLTSCSVTVVYTTLNGSIHYVSTGTCPKPEQANIVVSIYTLAMRKVP